MREWKELTKEEQTPEAGYREALRRIEEWREKGEGVLDLIWLRLLKIPPEVGGLMGLQELSLDFNQISDLGPLVGLVRLQGLSLSGNQISDLGPLAGLVGLKKLNLNHNQVSDLGPLARLMGLRELRLDDNKISDLRPLAEFVGLQKLWLIDNQISDLGPLTGIVGLQELYLNNNYVSDLGPLGGLVGLHLLSIKQNQISNIDPLAGLVSLQWLSLNDNKVSDIWPLFSLLEKSLSLFFNEKFFVEGLHLSNNPLVNPPLEIAQQGTKAVLRYWALQDRAGVITNQEGRILLVGEGGAGKTSLHKKLYNPEVLISREEGKGKEAATVGINVGTTPYVINTHNSSESAQLFAYLWDFGGQEEQYLTHQYFFEPESLYVLVVDARTQSVDFGYWFRIINLLGRQREEEQIPVLIVMNEIDAYGTDLPALRQYREQFPYLDLRIQAVNLGRKPEEKANDPRFAVLQQLIADTFSKLPIIGREIAAPYPEIRKSLREVRAGGTNYLPYEAFAELCIANSLQVGPEVTDFARYLHALGEVIYYHHLCDEEGNPKLLARYVLLNPTWATEAIYLILGEKEVREKYKGVFSKEVLEKHWRGYTDTEKRLLENLLLEDAFEVCFPLAGRPGYYLAPSLLPRDGELPFAPAEGQGLRFRYVYPQILPKGLVSRLIVRLHKRIKDNCYYRTGVLLEYKTVTARVEMLTTAEGNDNVIDIWLDRGGEDAIHLLRMIRDEVEDIHQKSFKNIQVEELVPCPCATCRTLDQPYFFEYSYLKDKQQQSPSSTVECRMKPFHQVAIITILEGVLPTAEVKQFKREVTLSEDALIRIMDRPTTHIEKVEGGLTQVEGDQYNDQRVETPRVSVWQYTFSPLHVRGLVIAFALAVAVFLAARYFLPAEWLAHSWLVGFFALAAGIAWALTRTNIYFGFAQTAFFTGFGILGLLNAIPKFEGVIRARWENEQGEVSTVGNLVLDAPVWLQVTILLLTVGLTAFCLWLSWQQERGKGKAKENV